MANVFILLAVPSTRVLVSGPCAHLAIESGVPENVCWMGIKGDVPGAGRFRLFGVVILGK